MPTPTNLHTNPTNTPTPYIPTLPLHTYPTPLQTLQLAYMPQQPAMPLTEDPTTHLPHQRYQHAIVRCSCVLPVIAYIVLRNLLAKLLQRSLIEFVESLLKEGGMLNSPDNLQFWQIAQTSYDQMILGKNLHD